jgi:hypothetical protein
VSVSEGKVIQINERKAIANTRSICIDRVVGVEVHADGSHRLEWCA